MTALPLPLVLPRAGALTGTLVAPADDLVDPAERRAVVGRLEQGLAQLAPALEGRHDLRIDRYVLASGAAEADDAPFQWSPRTARRLLGLDAVRACARGRCRTPAEAVAATIDQAVRDASEGRARPRSPDGWLAAAGPGVRAVARAEAVTWATQLWTTLDWRRFAGPPSIGRDEWWRARAVPGLALQGRAEVRALTAAPGGGEPDESASLRPSALLTLLAGTPGPTARVELGLPALVDVLAHPARPTPARVVGWWPACGRAVLLPVDRGALEDTVDAVLGAAGALAERAAIA
ncbi:MAG TPA: hypothetical protein VK277_14090 [Acidimicrobiales bacterium]|nr:hypothetical protein [Acidimicrobiales bacterium]